MAIARHVQWIKQGADAWNKRRSTRHFVPSLKNADLSGLNLSQMNLRGAQLSGANLEGANLSGAILLGAHLLGANLTGANLEGSKLTAAVMTGAFLKNSNLSYSYLDECDLRRADLRNADLRGAYLLSANLFRARLSQADFRTLNDSPVSLMFVDGLVQQQVDDIKGDTGIKLPSELSHPSDWPIWVDPNPEVGPDITVNYNREASAIDPSIIAPIFISYASADRERILIIKSILADAGLPVWWDQDLLSGDNWREQIDYHLSHCSAVLTFWTDSSSASKAVAEEAARAQRDRKLVHVRLDNTNIPYGFSETQYADLRQWDGSFSHPEIRRLVQALKDKIYPPGFEEIQRRLMSAAPMAAIIDNGKITAKDSPPTSSPSHPDDIDLEERLKAQETSARKLFSALNTLDNNLGESIRFDLNHFIDQVKQRPASWYILSDSIADLKYYLDMGDEFSWPGSTRNSLVNLCKAHEALRPRLQPQQPPFHSSDASLPPPMPDPAKLSDKALKNVTEVTVAAFRSEEAGNVLSEPALRTADYLAIEIDEARVTEVTSYSSEERKLKKIRNGVIALAGFVGTTIVSIGQGVGSNVLTAPEAAKTLMNALKKLFDMLTALF